MAAPSPQAVPPVTGATDERYARYVLGVLVIVYVFNFLDRQILSILAERIKADLGLTDAQIGFLYGTAFAIFYAVFGIPLGRLADVWDRRRLISIGLAVWSLMTMVSGLSQNFAQLATARIGVGVGEASASPAAYSLLSDYFPAAKRATVLAIYSSGIYIGAGLGIGIGGLVVGRWDAAWAGTTPPLALRGWQVAFFLVGIPGLLLSLWVRTLREPRRGQAEGIFTEEHPRPYREALRELRAVLPPFTILHLALEGAAVRVLRINVLSAAAIAGVVFLLVGATGSVAQWIALGIGVYSGISWAQALKLRDRVGFELIFRNPAIRYTALGFAFLAFGGYGVGFWTPPFFVRVHGVNEATAGFILGGTAAVAGWLGITFGGVLSDRWRRSSPNGRLYVGMLTALLPMPIAFLMFTTRSTTLAFVLSFPLSFLSSMWIGPGASTVQDLVLPRMRASASAAYLLVVTFIGLALGPYTIGYLSFVLGDLGRGILASLVASLLALLFSLLATRHLEREESNLLTRARALGEPGV
jgi:MFS family permease